jgi:hypothetical protein
MDFDTKYKKTTYNCPQKLISPPIISGYKWFPTRYFPYKKPLSQKRELKSNLSYKWL